MKFTKEFQDILKHFSYINRSMYFREGNIQTVISGNQAKQSAALIVRAKTNVVIEKSFAVLDLSKFLNTIKLFSDPDIIVDERTVVISEKDKTVSFTLTKPEFIFYEKNPDKYQKFSGIEADLSKDNLKTILDMYGIFKFPHISFIGKEGKFYIKTSNEEVPSSDEGMIELDYTDETFKATVLASSFMPLPDDYKVIVSRKGVIYLESPNLEYFIPVQQNVSVL